MRISVTLLQYEHGIIRQTVDVLAEVIKSGKAKDKEAEVKELLSFLVDYLDEFHHAKEEECFYPHVVELFPQFKDEVDAIYEEHEVARRMLDDALSAIEEEDWDSLGRHGMNVVRHMTAHVEKEEDDIFPTVDDNLPLDKDEEINECYQAFNLPFGEDYYQKAEMFANDIQDRLLGKGFFDKGIF